MEKQVTILLAEDITSLNKGEAAIFFGMLESFKVFNDILFINISRHAEDVRNYSCEDSKIVKSTFLSENLLISTCRTLCLILVGCLSKMPGVSILIRKLNIDVLQSFLKADIIFIGHDNIFAFKAGALRSYWPIVAFAKLTGKKTVAYGVTVGPLTKSSSIKNCIFKRYVLNKIDLITTRDRQSVDFLAQFGVEGPKVELTADLAFLLKPARSEDVDSYLARLGIDLSRPIVGITATRFLAAQMQYFDGHTLIDFEEKYSAFCTLMASVTDMMIEEFGVIVMLIAHVIGPSDFSDDRTVNTGILKRVNRKDKVVIVNDDLSTDMLKGIIGRLDLLVGARTHSLIAAASQGVPIVGFTDTDRFKTNGIFGEQLGQQDYLIFAENMTGSGIRSVARQAWHNRMEIRSQLIAKMQDVIKNATRNGEMLKCIVKG